MIKVSNLTKRYGDKLAVRGISFEIDNNGVVGFLGPNGAGKSTTMNMITGYISMTSGSVTVDGVDLLHDPMTVKKNIGYLPELPPLYKDLTVTEYLNVVYGLKKCKLNREEHLNHICEEVGILPVKDRLISNLSKGYQQRVGIAQALVGDPKILILDEPTVGLDPSQIIEIRNLIKDLGKTRIIILSTHILSEVQLMCERIIIISQGRIVADDSVDNIELVGEKGTLVAEIIGNTDEVINTLEKIDGVRKVDFSENKYTILSSGDLEVRKRIFYALAENKMPLISIYEAKQTLESLFIELTDDTYADTYEEGGEEQ
ncbi:MAG: ATP-binding cassette domain-containing protein [Oscillospiraceae bacterium]|nr:ATP-binding cassette domain-containing protein [Oscillospiraceae bacterium]